MLRNFVLFSFTLCATTLYALQGGPTQPDYAQFEPSEMPDLVSMQTGNFAYSLPLGELPGPYGYYPLSVAYHAGISPQQEATWVGLGWLLNPGVINRDVRGVPDDQFHGGTLGYIYQYSAMRMWSLDMGWSCGVVSIGETVSSTGGVGFSATVGPKLEGVAGVGFTVGTDAVGVEAVIGKKNVGGLNASLMFSTTDGKASLAAGAFAGTENLNASAGVQYTQGQKVSYSVGFGDASGTVGIGMSLSPNGINYSVKTGPLSANLGKKGSTISVGGASLSVSNAPTKGGSHTSSVGFAVIIPTHAGVFSLGFNQSLQEYWMRSATSDYLYGYIYQAGPAIVADGKNDVAGMPGASAGTSTSHGSIPWKWTLKGRTLESMGEEEMHPAYDMYSVASEGVSGTFRPFAREEAQLYKKISDQKTDDNSSVEEYSTLLFDDTTNWPYLNEFKENSDSSGVSRASADIYKSYINCVADSNCSPYELYVTNFRNEGNRLVYRKNKDAADTVRTGMTFLFAGEGGYFESENYGEGEKRDRTRLSDKLLRRRLDGYDYALYGSRKVEPIFEDDSPVGKLKGFVVTSSDGTRYYFEQPVRSYLKVDYSINQAKGAPLFIDKQGSASDNFWEDFGTAFVNFGKWYLKHLTPYSYLEDTYNFVFKKGTLTEKCKVDDNSESSVYIYSYQVNMNPYATQWLITEIRGADFVELGDSITDNVGYNVKFHYTEPSIYRWRTPYARPGLAAADLPNYRLPRNGYTPSGCDSRMYQAGFGIKEYVYLKSIETATHRVDFVLNDPSKKAEERVDGKGWEFSYDNKARTLPMMVQASLAVVANYDASKDSTGFFVNGSAMMKAVSLTPKYIYTSTKLPEPLLKALAHSGSIAIMNLSSTSPSVTNYINKDSLYKIPTIMSFKIADTSNVMEPTSGDDIKYGLYRIKVELPKDSAYHAFQITYRSNLYQDSLMVFGENGTKVMYPYINWSEIAFSEIDSTQNQMRYLKEIDYYNKQDTTPYRKFKFAYDYSLQPKTLNSYCLGKYPKTNQDIVNSPDSVSLDICSDSSAVNSLYGKLTLKSITESGCRYGKCASLPPFEFSYNSPSATSTRISTKDGWVNLSQNLILSSPDDSVGENQFAESYYDSITDVDASIIASSDAIDDWGFWASSGSSENHKVLQTFADYGATAWSLNKVVDPAGGALEIEYERDVYKNGEDNANDKDYAELASVNECKNYRKNYTVNDSDTSKLCMELGDLYWREQCLGPRVAFWDTVRPAGYTGSGFEYLDTLGLDTSATLYYNIQGSMGTKIRCGAFGWGRCSRTRAVALLGDGRIQKIMESSSTKERRLLVIDRQWGYISAGLQAAVDKINDGSWKLKSQYGFIWARKQYPEMKGGDVRVKRLTRYDIDRTAQTVYDYAPGEMAQLPDSAYNTVMGNRFYASKISFALPDVDMAPKSRIVGFDDNDLIYLPGSSITYPKVTVKNTDSYGNTLNGKTEFDYITPETGVPKAFVDPETRALLHPFMKINTVLFKWGGNEKSSTYDSQNFLIGFTLLDSLKNPVGAMRTVLVSQDGVTSFSIYDDNIRNARYISAVARNPFSDSLDIQMDTVAVGDSLTDFNEMSLSVSWFIGSFDFKLFDRPQIRNNQQFFLHRTWLRSQKDGYYPILYKYVEYAQEKVKIDSQDSVAEFEHNVTYHDLTAFLGLNYRTAFYRGNGDNSIPIKVDSSIYSTVVPDILDGVDNVTASADSVRKKVGRQVERWHYDRVLQCTDGDKGKNSICEKQYASLFERDGKKDSKNFTYIRYPAFQVGSVTYTGHENQAAGGSPDLWGRSSLENHRFDPLTGSPTATLAATPAPAGEMRKLTQKTPHYMLSGDTSLANEMFRRNMLSQNFLDELYSGTTPSSAPWNSIAVKDSLRSFSVSPFRFVPDSVYSRDIAPIVAWGTYKSKALPQDIISGSEVLSALSIYADASDTLPPLSLFDGTHIRSVDKHFKVRETEDDWGRILTTQYSEDGLYQTGLFFPARLSETAQIVPNGKSIAAGNCSVNGSAYSVDVHSGGIVATGAMIVTCVPAGSLRIAEYRWKHNGEWSTERDVVVTPGSFKISLASGDVLNYLRVYPDSAQAKTYIYDAYGDLVQVVAEDNTSTYYEYDSFGQLAQIRDDDGVSYKSHHREFWNDSLDVVPVAVGK